MSFQRILIALDDSPISIHAMEVGKDLAKAVGAEIALLHVLDPRIAYAPEGGFPASNVLAEFREQARRLLRCAARRIGGDPPPWEYLVEGNVSRKIVTSADEWKADLIVMGSHGRTGIALAFLGSTAESVVRHSRIPVLTVRGRG